MQREADCVQLILEWVGSRIIRIKFVGAFLNRMESCNLLRDVGTAVPIIRHYARGKVLQTTARSQSGQILFLFGMKLYFLAQ